jgi:hypothetical protein
LRRTASRDSTNTGTIVDKEENQEALQQLLEFWQPQYAEEARR